MTFSARMIFRSFSADSGVWGGENRRFAPILILEKSVSGCEILPVPIEFPLDAKNGFGEPPECEACRLKVKCAVDFFGGLFARSSIRGKYPIGLTSPDSVRCGDARTCRIQEKQKCQNLHIWERVNATSLFDSPDISDRPAESVYFRILVAGNGNSVLS